jgi:FixJ family two-component response regulator
MRAGAEDFLGKTSPGTELLAAVERALVRDGTERQQREKLVKQRKLRSSLSEREREVLALVVKGKLNKEIASSLGLQERTVKFHRSNITAKLGIPSVAELTIFVQSLGGPRALCFSTPSRL